MAALADLVDRASAADVTSLVTDLADAPMHVGAVLLLDTSGDWDLGAAIEALDVRSRSVPRLRQRLQSAPFGCGRPFWIEDPAFSIDRHVTTSVCTGASDIDAVLRVAAEIVGRPLPRDRPLWSATFVTELDAGQVGLVVVFHHVLADGIGGLAVLANLVDGPDPSPALEPTGAARATPGTGALLLDATRARLEQVSGLPGAIRNGVAAIAAMRSDRPHRAPASSLNRPTGPRRQYALVHTALSPVVDLAHAHEATVNDVMLTAIGGALHRLLAERHEDVGHFIVSVPVTARAEATATDLGNQITIATIDVLATGDPVSRLRAVATETALATRRRRTAPAPADILGPVFRILARLGMFRWFIDHQSFVNTFVTNLHGPGTSLTILGAVVSDVIPISVATGNVTVSFAVLSYAGRITVTVIADPRACPDLQSLTHLLQDELDSLVQ